MLTFAPVRAAWRRFSPLAALRRGRVRRLQSERRLRQDQLSELLEDRTLLSVTPLQLSNSLGQIPVSFDPSVSDDGTLITFESQANLTGENPEELATQVFLLDTTSGTLEQITHIPAAVSGAGRPQISGDGSTIVYDGSDALLREPISVFTYDVATGVTTQLTSSADSLTPVVNRDGTRIAFASEADFTGQNADGSREVFLYDRTADTFTQITDGTRFSSDPSINADGTLISFRSNEDLTGGNADLSSEVFLYDANTAVITQVTATSGSPFFSLSDQPVISADGTRIAFISDRDITGNNADENTEVFYYDIGSAVTTQVTTTTGESGAPQLAITSDGDRIVFDSNADVTGGNADGSSEVFTFDVTAGAFNQITSSPRHPYFDPASFGPAVSAEGSRIVLGSSADLLGGNPDINTELFVFDEGVGLTQLTDTRHGGSYVPAVDALGTTTAWFSPADLTGQNADGTYEVFLFDVASGVVDQLTDTNGTADFSGGVDISGDASRVTFVSTADYTGDNADGNAELFYMDLGTRDITQVTETLGGGLPGGLLDPINPLFNFPNQQPSISFDGSRIAFVSDRDLTGGNSDENAETYLFDITSGQFTQVTNTTGFPTFGVSTGLSSDGDTIVFRSNGDPAGNNADGSDEIFLFDVPTSSYQQITNTGAGAFTSFESPAVSGDGSWVAFTSTGDFTGGNSAGNPEVFVYDTGSNSFTQVTSGLVNPLGLTQQRLTFTDDGSTLSFLSAGNHSGENPNGFSEVFLYDTGTGATKQISHSDPVRDFETDSVQFPTISGNGEAVVWQGTFIDPVGVNPDLNAEIFFANLGTPEISSTKNDSLGTDNNSNGLYNPGDTIDYEVQIHNDGAGDAQGVTFTDVLDPNTTLVPGSINVSPLAFDDIYHSSSGLRFQRHNLISDGGGSVVITDPAQGLFANDLEFLGDTFTLTTFDSVGSGGGTLNVNTDGTFEYDAPTSGTNSFDRFTYTISDNAGLSDTGQITFDLRATVLTIGGVPILLNHIDSSDAGDGTFENPFGTLNAANLDPEKDDRHIVYAHSGSTFAGEGYNLSPDQRLLGEGDGNAHLVDTDQLGLVTLPMANGPGERPLLSNGTGPVFAAAATEISNFRFDAIGPVLQNVNGNVNGNRLDIVNPLAGDGLSIFESTGTFTFTDVHIGSGAIGILIDGRNAGEGHIIFGSDVVDPAAGLFGPSSVNQNAPLISFDHNGSFTLSESSSITAPGGSISIDTANATYDLRGMVRTFDDGSGFGAGGVEIDNSDGTFSFGNLSITDPDGAGLMVTGGSSDVVVQSGGSISSSKPTAIAVLIAGDHSGSVNFNASSSIDVTGGIGVAIGGSPFDPIPTAFPSGTYTFESTNDIRTAPDLATGGGQTGIYVQESVSGSITFGPSTHTEYTGDPSTFGVANSSAIQVFGITGFAGTLIYRGSVTATGGGLIDIERTTPGSVIRFERSNGNTMMATGVVDNSGGTVEGISLLGIDGTFFSDIPTTLTNADQGFTVGFGNGTVSVTDLTVDVSRNDVEVIPVVVNGFDGEARLTNLNLTTSQTTASTNAFVVLQSGSVIVDGNSSIRATGEGAISVDTASNIDLSFAHVTSTDAMDPQGVMPVNGISIKDVAGGSLTIDEGTISNAERAGISITDSSGTFEFGAVDINNTGFAGVEIDGFGAGSSFSFDGSITDNDHTLVRIQNTAADSTVSFNRTNGNSLTSTGNQFPSLDFLNADGDITITTPSTFTDSMFSPVFSTGGGGTWSFTDLTVTDLRGLNGGLDMFAHTGTINLTNLNITTNTAGTGTGAPGISVGGNNIMNVFGDSSIHADGGPALCLIDINTVNMTFQEVSSTNATSTQIGPCGDSGLNFLDNDDVTFEVTGTTTVHNSGHIGINISDAHGTFTFADVDIDGIELDGVSIGSVTSASGTVSINNGTIQNTGRAGVQAGNTNRGTSAGTININSTTFSGIGTVGIDVQQGGAPTTLNVSGSNVTGAEQGILIEDITRANVVSSATTGGVGFNAVEVNLNGGATQIQALNNDWTAIAGNASGVVINTSGSSTLCMDARGNAATGSGAGFGVELNQSGGSTLGIIQPDLATFGSDNPLTSTLNTTGTITFDCSFTPLLAAPVADQPGTSPKHASTAPALPEPISDVDSDSGVEAAGLDGRVTADAPASEPQVVDTAPPTAGSGNQGLTADELQFVVDASLDRWIQTGLNEQQIAALQTIEFRIVDMPGWYLGAADGTTVRIDADGAGLGWFVDSTPLDDSEFSDGSAHGMDLLTTVMHEMGHVLGLADIYDTSAAADLMFGFLSPGERRTPAANQAAEAVAGSVASTAFIGSPISIGTLPAGKSVTITFSATINDPFPSGVTSVTNQGTVSGENFDDVATDDPATANPNDETVTPVQLGLPPVTVSISDAAPVTEGNPAHFTVTLSRDLDVSEVVVVAYNTVNGTAAAPGDFTAVSGGNLTFNPGAPRTQTFSITTNDDAVPEVMENFSVMIAAQGAVVTDDTASATINDTPDLPVLSIDDVTVTEGEDAVFTVTLDHSPVSTVTVSYATADDTADEGDDYTSTSGTLTFDPGVMTQTITVPTIDDTDDESNERFTVNLLSATNATIGPLSSGQGTIRDNDSPQLPSVSINSPGFVDEGDDVVFTVTLDAASGSLITVSYNTADGSAVSPDDYTGISNGTLTFDPGVTSQTITVSTLDDSIDEMNETFTVDLTSATGAEIGSPASGTATLTDNDIPTLSISDAGDVTEGQDAIFTVSLDIESIDPVTVVLSTADGTATAPDDYTPAPSLTVTLDPGETSRSVSIMTVDDTLDEFVEDFALTIADVQGGRPGTPNFGVARIIDNDEPQLPTVTISDAPAVVEGGSAVFTVSLDTTPASTVTVSYATADGTAVSPDDYTATSGQLTFDPGVTEQTITVMTVDDAVEETTETFFVDLLSATNASIGVDASGTGRIRDNDVSATVHGRKWNDIDGNGIRDDGEPWLNGWTIELVNAAGNVVDTMVTMDHDVDGSGDIDPETERGWFWLTAVGDDLPGEFTVREVMQAGWTQTAPSDGVHQITLAPFDIANDIDFGNQMIEPVLTISDAVLANEGDDGFSSLVFTITRDHNIGAPSVPFSTQDGTAIAGLDYEASSGMVEFEDGGSLTATITIPIFGENLVEQDETFLVVLGQANCASVGDGEGLGTITNDDMATITINNVAQTEGDSGTTVFRFNVRIDNPVDKEIRLVGSTIEASAEAGSDFTARSDVPLVLQSTPQPGEIVPFEVTVFGDTEVERDERFFAHLLFAENPERAVILGDNLGRGTIRNDDLDPFPTVDVIDARAVTEGANSVFHVRLSQPPTERVGVELFTTDGTATAPEDYVERPSLMVIFDPGDNLSKRVLIPTVNDQAPENTEHYFLNILNVVNGVIGDGNARGSILDNDDPDRACSGQRPGVRLEDGVLIIVGDSRSNDIDVLENRDEITVDIDGDDDHTFDRDLITELLICGGRGADDIDRKGSDTTLPATIDGGRGPDALDGGEGPDMIIGGNANDRIEGEGGDDTIKGGAGNDNLRADDGDDFVHGGSGRDRIFGKDGNDILIGGDGRDRIRGGDGHDVIDAGRGDDVIEGNDGRDLLIGGEGLDDFDGDSHGDILVPGTTSLNTSALSDILDEWRSGRTYDERVANIRAGTGPILDGTRLSTGAAATVFDDDDEDLLKGNTDRDWFFASLTDDIEDRKLSEELDLI